MSITEQTLKALGRSRANMRELQVIQLSPGAHADAFDALGGASLPFRILSAAKVYSTCLEDLSMASFWTPFLVQTG